MASIGQYLKEVEQAKPMRVRAFQLAHEVAQELGCRFYPAVHFLTRFDQRSISPIRATGSFELAIRMLRANRDRILGKQVAMLVSQHVFIFDCRQAGRICAVSFWWTDKPANVALAGRGDIFLESA